MNASQSPEIPKKRRPRLVRLREDYFCSFFNEIRGRCELGKHIYEVKPGDEDARAELYETLFRQISKRLQEFEENFLRDVVESRRAIAEFDAAEKRRQAEERENEKQEGKTR